MRTQVEMNSHEQEQKIQQLQATDGMDPQQMPQIINLIPYDPATHGLVSGLYEVVTMADGQQLPEGVETATLVSAAQIPHHHLQQQQHHQQQNQEQQQPNQTATITTTLSSSSARSQTEKKDLNESVYDFPEPGKPIKRDAGNDELEDDELEVDDEEDEEDDGEDEEGEEDEEDDIDEEDDDESIERSALITNANHINNNNNNNNNNHSSAASKARARSKDRDASQAGAGSAKRSRKPKTTSSGGHVCNYCNYTTHKRYLLSRHMKSHSEDRPHRCGICERGFKTAASLQNHVNTHSGVRPHPCKNCDAQFTTSGELVRHVRYKHTHEKPHKCPECDYASVELSKLKRHMRCHTGERPYQCQHCTYASPDTYKLKRHLRIHTGEKPYECNVCQARFTQSNSLKAHKLIHSGNKPVYRCDKCPATCGRKTDLRIHVQKLHTAEKPLTCKRCDKTYPDRYQYKIHLKSHEGEKCFKCELCSYSSVSARHLDSHMLIHTDQKPFACDQCDQSFRQKQLLKRHRNLYHNPTYIAPTPREKTHECPVCSKAFRHKGNLMRHLSSHDPETKGGSGRATRASARASAKDEIYEDEDDDSGATIIGEERDDSTNLDLQDSSQPLVTKNDQMFGYEVVSLRTSGQSGNASAQSDGKPIKLPPSDLLDTNELNGKLKEQKQKDVSECFGFRDDDEEDEAILSMPSSALN